MKICFFTPIFPPYYSGATLQAISMAKVLREKGHNIFFLRLSEEKRALAEHDGFTVYNLHVKSLSKIIAGNTSPIEDFLLIFKLFVLLARLRNEFDILHCHIFAHPFFSLGLLGKLLRKRTVAKITMNNDIEFGRIGTISSRIGEHLGKQFDALVGINSQVTEKLTSIWGSVGKARFIPNGVDSSKFYPLPPNDRRSLKRCLGFPDQPIVSFVGAISLRKGVHLLLEIWPEILREVPDAVLILIGPRDFHEGIDGDFSCYQDALRIVSKFGLDDRVIFTGRIQKVNKYLQVSDVMAFPSSLEGMPNVVLEAMSCGVPVVAFNIPGVSDVIKHGLNGELVEKMGEFREAIIRLLKNEKLRAKYSRNAIRTVSEQFSNKKIGDKYIELYRELIR